MVATLRSIQAPEPPRLVCADCHTAQEMIFVTLDAQGHGVQLCGRCYGIREAKRRAERP